MDQTGAADQKQLRRARARRKQAPSLQVNVGLPGPTRASRCAGLRLRSPAKFGTEAPSYASFYRETKLDDEAAWLQMLADVREATGILETDECAWVTGGASGVTCEEHFGFDF